MRRLMIVLLTVLAACLASSIAAYAAEGALSDMPTEARSAETGEYISFVEHRIDDEGLTGVPMRGADGCVVADLDGDGHFDIVSCHEDSSHLRIAFGTADPDEWHTCTLASGDVVGGVEDAALGDLNGDGRIDIACACEKRHLVVFLSPDNPRQMDAWVPVKLQESLGRGSWIRTGIADINDDGKPDIIGVNKGRTNFSYFTLEGEASDPAAWHEQVIGKHAKPINARAVDIDDDGDLDVMAASRGEKMIVLYENTGGGTSWTEHPVHTGKPASEGFMMEFTDLDGDGRLDIITEADHDGLVFWLRQPESFDEGWPVHIIGDLGPDDPTGLENV
ncbi:MAG: VCBS repeat-containing protein [Armatimonadota bacterium]